MTQQHLEPPRPHRNEGRDLQANGDPPIGQVLAELWENTEKLIRQEISLASAELDQKAQRFKREAAAAGAGAGMMLAGALALVATVILLLSEAMEPWLAALLTSVVLLGGGFALLKTKRPSPAELKPDRTLKNLEKDVQTFREATK